jgi:hypothetical protein
MTYGAAQYTDQVMFWLPDELLFDFLWVGFYTSPQHSSIEGSSAQPVQSRIFIAWRKAAI